MAASVVLACLILAAGGPEIAPLVSPDKRIVVEADMPSWSVSLDGHRLFEGNQLALDVNGDGDILNGAKVVSESVRTVNKRIRVLFGRASQADDHYSERRFALEGKYKRRFDVVFRVYNDAVAVRYEVAKLRNETKIVVQDEATSFHPVGGPTAYVQYLENYTTSHEHTVDVVPFEQVKEGNLLDTPLTLQFPHATAALTEANLRRYAGMGLHRTGDRLVSDLTPRPDGTKAVVTDKLVTPWRVILLADNPGKFLESNTLYCLADPNEIGDTSWIKPGKMTWPWWNGNVVKDGKPEPPIFSLEAQKHYIDFAAGNNIRYHSTIADNTDTPWYHQYSQGVTPSESTDVTRVGEGLDLPAIKQYADSKGVKLWTWVHSGALRGHVEEAFAAFEKMGWAGMMVDFFDHDDQDTVEFAEDILRAAAKHHILIHFHGIWKPTGLERTFPNLMNHEGALNQEYMKWSDLVTPSHILKLLFTRMVAGPMDFHSGGFRAVRPQDFKINFVSPNVLGTRAFMLASYVCFDNPNPMVADYPDAYRDQAGFEVIRQVPTYWDETRVLLAEPGKLLVTARRKGKDWWIAGMSAGPARKVRVKQTFLGDGKYHGFFWTDPPSTTTDPNIVCPEEEDTKKDETHEYDIGTDGGFVVHLVLKR